MTSESKKAYNKAYHSANKEKIARRKLAYEKRDRCNRYQRKFGITLEEYDEMYQEQEGKCAICGAHQLDLKKRLAVDHDHETGSVRALLCLQCNTGLGNFKDSIDLLTASIKYLKRHGAE